jgi:spore maturation protein SpmA
VGPTIFATFCSTLVAVVADSFMRRRYGRGIR